MFLVETELKACHFAILIVVHLKQLAFDEIVRVFDYELIYRDTPIRKAKYNVFAIAAGMESVNIFGQVVTKVRNTY